MPQTIDEIKHEILLKLNLRAEFESFGIKMAGEPNAKGWIKCPSPWNPDKNPSAGVCVDNSSSYAGNLRVFNNSSLRDSHNLFDLAYELSPVCAGKEFVEILEYYAKKTGVKFQRNVKRKIVATYDYNDIDGKLIYQVVRYDPKDFRQRQPASDYTKNKPTWIWNLQEIAALPYNIHFIANNKILYLCEGEKDADNLVKLGLPGISFHGGSSSVKIEALLYLKGKDVIFFPDDDDAGKTYRDNLMRELNEIVTSLKIVEFSGVNKKGYDVSNWIEDGGTKDQLLKLCKNAKDVEIVEDPIDKLNEIHAVVIVGGKVRILHETIDIEGKSEIQFLTLYDFKVLYSNRKIPNPFTGKGIPKTIFLSDAWIGSSKRREYQSVIFEPQINNRKFYNMYNGLSYDPVYGDWSKFKNHIYENICNSNMEHFDWLLTWMARIVQQPGGKKPGTAVVLRGDKGVGKGMFAEIFGKIFGHHFQLITNAQQATGRFNSPLKDCILLYLDEAFYAGDKSAEGVLKGLITGDKHQVELKGKDAFQVSNHVNCIIASNNDWVVSVGNNERRYFVLDVSKAHIQDHKYFAAIDKQMNNNNGISAMLHDLLLIDISKQNLRQAPKTQGLIEQLLLNFSSFEKFWFDLLLSSFDFDDDIQATKLYDKYIDYCKKMNTRYIIAPAIFGKNLVKFGDVKIERRRIENGQRSRFYVFPARQECKSIFEKHFGMTIPWKIINRSSMEIEIGQI